MKTPREILLDRHRAVEPELDRIRKEALSAAPQKAPVQGVAESRRRSAGEVMAGLWRELFWRPRFAWMGMAGLWVVLWVVNRQLEPSSAMMVSARSRPTPEAVRAFEEQRRLLAELLQPPPPTAAEPARPRPGPRSEIRTTLRVC